MTLLSDRKSLGRLGVLSVALCLLLACSSRQAYLQRAEEAWERQKAERDAKGMRALELMDQARARNRNRVKTPLHEAAIKGDERLVEKLLRGGADPNAVDREGYTPLHWAVGMEHPEVVAILLKHGALTSVRDNEGKTPLHAAAAIGNKRSVGMLLGAGSDVNARDFHEGSPIQCAAFPFFRDREEIMKMLVEHGADVSATATYSSALLCAAIESEKKDLLDLLLTKNPDVNGRRSDGHGSTPLHVAVKKGDKRTIVLLLKRKDLDLSPRDFHDCTPLSYALRRPWRPDIIILLRRHGAKL